MNGPQQPIKVLALWKYMEGQVRAQLTIRSVPWHTAMVRHCNRLFLFCKKLPTNFEQKLQSERKESLQHTPNTNPTLLIALHHDDAIMQYASRL